MITVSGMWLYTSHIRDVVIIITNHNQVFAVVKYQDLLAMIILTALWL
jgi:hypothetical protein